MVARRQTGVRVTMQAYEYKVIPAPRRGEKAKGAKSTADRFGVALAQAMNGLAADGWEYLRAETLPCDERVGFTGTATHFHHMLVFRRALARAAEPLPVASVPAAPRAPAPSTGDAAALIPDAAPEATVLAALVTQPPHGAAPPLGPASHPAPSTRANGRL
jgi:hypothetical protein